jgi:hypothetical protein
MKTGNFKEQTRSEVYEDRKFQRTSWVRVYEKREISKNEQAGSGYMKNEKFQRTNKLGPSSKIPVTSQFELRPGVEYAQRQVGIDFAGL